MAQSANKESGAIMRIGIDGHVLGKNVGGVERFVRELVNQLPSEAPMHDYIVFVTKAEYTKVKGLEKPKNVKYVALSSANPLIQRLILLPWLVYRYRLNALLIQRLAPWFCGQCQLIVAIHDLTPIKFAAAYQGLSNQLVRLLTKNTIQRADLILTPTLAIKAEIMDYCPQVKAPIHAFYNGVDTANFVQNNADKHTLLPIQGHYLLTVGAIEKRKNLETMIAMLPLLRDETIQLAIVGGVRDATYYAEILALIKQLNLSHRVVHLGFMQEAMLIALYQQANVFITASVDEGFNIPPLESMACGAPVVCSRIAVHQELFADAAVFYDTLSSHDLVEKVQTLLDDASLVQKVTLQAKAKVKQFTWQKTAQNVAHALRSLK
jgi:glycosyltransferase involved in cell wall biosynthesis